MDYLFSQNNRDYDNFYGIIPTSDEISHSHTHENGNNLTGKSIYYISDLHIDRKDEKGFDDYTRDELSRTFSSSSRRSYILLDFLSEHTLDFVLHRLFCGLAEMDTHDIGGLAYLLSDSRARDVRGVAGRCIVHSKSSCKMKNARRFHRAVVLWGKKARRQL